jgi:ribosomal protein S18 acetylase RimI-like enzyme
MLHRNRRTALNYIALNNRNQVLGYIFYDKRLKEISAIGVKKEFSGKGIGSKLLRKILSVEKNVSINLQVLATNKSAQAFYKRFGFRFSGEKEKSVFTQKKNVFKYTLLRMVRC